MATSSVVGRVLAIGAAVAAVALVPGAAGGQAAPACAQPYLPLFAFTTAPSQPNPPKQQVYPDHPVAAPQVDGTDLSYDQGTGPDMDGDGQADEVGGDGSTLTVTRGDGVLTLAQPGLNLTTTSTFRRADLDGDGRDEVLILGRPSGAGEDRAFVVPGTTATGAHQLADVAIEVPAGIVEPVGDQIGGAGDDLLVRAGSSGVLTSGDDVLAPGPGGTLAAFAPGSPPFTQGQPVGLLGLDDGPPVLVLAAAQGGVTVLSLWDEGDVTTFRTAGPSYSGLPRVTAVRTGERVLLVASDLSRGGALVFTWDLDDPCAVLPAASAPPTTTPTATGAEPVSGTARYTG